MEEESEGYISFIFILFPIPKGLDLELEFAKWKLRRRIRMGPESLSQDYLLGFSVPILSLQYEQVNIGKAMV